MSEENMKYLRRASISSGMEVPALDLLASLPGYKVEPIAEKSAQDRTHVLVTPTGDQIHLINGVDAFHLTTSNIIQQDQITGHVSVQADELTQLAKAAKEAEGLSVQVSMSDHDIETLQ